MACARSWPRLSPTAGPRPTSGPARRSASSATATSTWTPSWTACGASRSAAGWWWSRTSCPAARSGSRGRPRNSGTTVPFFRNEGSDMPPSFRLGLIGAGRMGRTHLRAFAGSDGVTVTAIAEVSEPARHAVESSGAALYPGIGPMLDGAALDGVLITAPSDQHGKIISEVAARGLPILCEKPCGVTAAQTRAAAEAATAAGVPFQVAYWRRYVPALRRLRERIAAGELGTVHLVTCYQWDDRPPTDEFRAHSGGIFADMGVHEFDQMRWLTGQEIASLAAVASGLVPGGLVHHDPGHGPRRSADVDSAQVILELSGGSCGIVSLGRFHPAGDMARAEAFGTNGTVR